MMRKISDINAARILNAVWTSKSISRIELSRRLSLDKSTVTKIVSDLMAKKLIRTSLKGDSGPNGGRKPIELVIQEGCGCVIGLDIQPHGYRAQVLDLSGAPLLEASEALSLGGSDLAQACVGIVSDLRQRMDPGFPPVLGVGIGIPGIVDVDSGTLVLADALMVKKPYPLVELVGERMGAPLIVDRDSRCGCMSVLAFRRDAPRNFIFVIGECRSLAGSTSIPNYLAVGMGIVLDGKVLYGDSGCAGEFMSIFHAEGSVNQFSPTDEEARRVENDPAIRRRLFEELATNVAFLAHMMDVNVIYLGGGIQRYEEELVAAMREAGRHGTTFPVERDLDVSFSPHGDTVVAYGAGGLALEGLFRIPKKGGANKTDFPFLLGL
jgi:predicted NBD/HSP70 family sugar kinase